MALIERKLDTRNKIMMGGLLIKAGLDDLHKTNKAALLGALVDIKNKLESDNRKEAKQLMIHYSRIGIEAFKK